MCVLIINSSIIAFANSAEPPSIIILINNPPEDISIQMISNINEVEVERRKLAWEDYFLFYGSDIHVDGNYRFRVTTGEKSFECSFNQPLQNYSEVLTLDISKQELSYGTYPLRKMLLVLIRVTLTLLIEGFVFYIFGFREKKSWIAFIIINLITQGLLNVLLSSDGILIGSFVVFAMLLSEVVILVAESISLSLLIKEKKTSIVCSYVLLANILSFILGGYMIANLPI